MARTPRVESEADARRVLKEVERRVKALQSLDFDALSFGQQRDFLYDEATYVAACCGRRSGKTEGLALTLLYEAHRHPRTIIPYITLSRPSAKRIMWPKLQEWDRRLELGAKFNHADLVMTIKNGAQIWLGGANDEAEIERYRGGAYPCVAIDEAQAFRSFLEPLVMEILWPAVLDYRGRILMTGTPNPSAMGYFHDATTGKVKGWSVHHWTVFSNPHIPHAEEEFEAMLALTGFKRSDPKIRREWFGEWVRDTEGLVYDIRDRNILDELPRDVTDWSFVLGIDVGYVDATAFVVMAYSQATGQCVVLRSFQKNSLIPSAVAVEVDKLMNEYELDAIVVDTGGLGKAYAEEMKQSYGIPCTAAKKRDKLSGIESLNGDLRACSMSVIGWANQDLLHDAALLQWNYDKFDGTQHGGLRPKLRLEEDKRTPNHLTDAMLYAYRECKHRLYDPELEAARPGSPEWLKAQEDEFLELLLGKEKPELPWWEA